MSLDVKLSCGDQESTMKPRIF